MPDNDVTQTTEEVAEKETQEEVQGTATENSEEVKEAEAQAEEALIEATEDTNEDQSTETEATEDKSTDIAEDPIFDVSDGREWYILSTYSGHEKKVAQQIDQRIKATGLDDQITQVLVPTQEKVVAKEGKKRTTTERIFPGYVLVKMIMNDDTWHLLRNTEGVTGFVGPSKKPTPMSIDEVKAIMAFTQVKQSTYESAYKVGDSVRVNDGPFKDFVGVIQEINEQKGQLTVLLSIFGRETPVTLDFLQVTTI